MIIALAINILIIAESAMGGESSGSQSLGFTRMIGSAIKVIFPNSLIAQDEDYLHDFLRKLFGHFLLFGLSGIFTTLTLLVNIIIITKKKLLIYGGISIGFGISLASFSELIQSFVPGRAGAFTDVLIDFSGYLLFALIVVFALYFLNIIYPSKENVEEKTGIIID